MPKLMSIDDAIGAPYRWIRGEHLAHGQCVRRIPLPLGYSAMKPKLEPPTARRETNPIAPWTVLQPRQTRWIAVLQRSLAATPATTWVSVRPYQCGMKRPPNGTKTERKTDQAMGHKHKKAAPGRLNPGQAQTCLGVYSEKKVSDSEKKVSDSEKPFWNLRPLSESESQCLIQKCGFRFKKSVSEFAAAFRFRKIAFRFRTFASKAPRVTPRFRSKAPDSESRLLYCFAS